jgi:hypothetical membrane protein
MTTMRMTRVPATSRPLVRSRDFGGRALLACGIVAALLYAVTDVLGGLRHPGYSFFSQAVSELMAAGAPSERLVDPLFIAYGVLLLAFGFGVWRHARGGRTLRVAGPLLMAYGAIGLTGPVFFEMQPRGSASVSSDLPHIALTAVLVLLTLLAIGLAAFAFGRRFRDYSIATILVLLGLGALSGPYAARLAAGEPTPGFGIVERVLIYAMQVWIAVLAIALLRRPRACDASSSVWDPPRTRGAVTQGPRVPDHRIQPERSQ